MKRSAGAEAKLRNESCCRVCGSTRNLTKHHLIPKRWWRANRGLHGRNDPRNLIPLCLYCHAAVDGYLSSTEIGRASVLLRQRIKRTQLRQKLSQEEMAFVARWMGWEWLNHHYPLWYESHS